jgi:hypothetical protein
MFSAKYNLRPEKSKDLHKYDTQAWSTVNELLLMTDFKPVPFIRTKLPGCVRAIVLCVCVCCVALGCFGLGWVGLRCVALRCVV